MIKLIGLKESNYQKKMLSLTYRNVNSNQIEIGVDEAGRGPLFGRVYAAAVVLPSLEEDRCFDPSLLKDSKKFTSQNKLFEAYDHIKQHAIAYHIAFCDESEIDAINIRKATHKAMHEAIKSVIRQIQEMTLKYDSKDDYLLCIDGNDFTPLTQYNKTNQQIDVYPYVCLKGGDNLYCHIAAASILAKVERDLYIGELCEQHPLLDVHYNIASNKGYGAKSHIDGIVEHGITPWHRKTFGICKSYTNHTQA